MVAASNIGWFDLPSVRKHLASLRAEAPHASEAGKSSEPAPP